MKRILIVNLVLVYCTSWGAVAPTSNSDQVQQQLQRLQQIANQAGQNQPPATTPPISRTVTPLTTQPSNAATAPAAGAAAGAAATAPVVASPMLPTTDSGDEPTAEAFANMTKSTLPLTPDQIRTLRMLFDANQKAAAEHPGVPPKPTSTSVMVNLAPGATPPVIRLSSGFVTSLVFLDSTGAPWPIKAYDIGDPKSFNIEWDKESNTLLVQAITLYKTGNLAVILKGLNTPVMITLIPGQQAVDYRVDLRVPGMGPNAIPTQDGLPGVGSPHLLNVLDGIPPAGSRRLKVNGGDADIWLLDGKIYVRTRLTVLSPGWISTLASADGTHAYEMLPTPLLLASYHGKMVKLSIEGY